jgi:hypothetical protein
LQRQLSGGTVKPAASAPAPAATPAAVPGPPVVQAPAAREVVQVPESEVVGSTGRWAAASAGPLARATQGIKPKAKPADDATSRMKRAVATTPRRAKAKPVEPKRAQRKAIRPAPEPVVEKAPVIVTPPPAQAPTEAPRPAAAAPAPAATPAPAPARVEPAPIAAPAPTTETEEAAAHRDALETFIRLTESDRQPHEANQVDQGAVRAALARTAARKKPGGEKLKGHDGPQETYGGPPPEPR